MHTFHIRLQGDVTCSRSPWDDGDPLRARLGVWEDKVEDPALRLPQGGDSSASLTVPEQGRRERSRTTRGGREGVDFVAADFSLRGRLRRGVGFAGDCGAVCPKGAFVSP